MSYEDDERMERFLEAMAHNQKRHKEDVLAAAEQSLAEVHTSDCPAAVDVAPVL